MVAHGRRWAAMALTAACFAGAPAKAQPAAAVIEIPPIAESPRRRITTDDLARIRDIASLSVDPDGERFAILVRQASPETNSFRTGWFVGTVGETKLTYVADGGEARQLVSASGRTSGDFGGSVARWSADGQWIAFTVKRDGEVQLWRARVDGGDASQVSHNPGDVRDFIWTEDGRRLLFTADTSRAERAATREARDREGYRLQEFPYMAMAIHSSGMPVPLSPNPALFSVQADGSDERPATPEERAAFERSRSARFSRTPGGTELVPANLSGAVRPPLVRPDGAIAWLAKVDESQMGQLPVVRLRASLTGRQEDEILCSAPECEGQYFAFSWWSPDGSEVLFIRTVGEARGDFSLFGWNPRTNAVRLIRSFADEAVQECHLATLRLICLRQQKLVPNHVAAVDIASGAVTVLADVNPEFRNFDLGRVERIEWETPDLPGADYARRSRGYLVYPPDYDPARRYPLYVAPYSAWGLIRGDAGDEHPLLVYAANDIVVLNSQFPMSWSMLAECADFACTMPRAYDPDQGYPHISTYAASTFAAIDAAAERANIDLSRVGIGGVSHGAFVPVYMVQLRDRLAALSVAGGSWSQEEYYSGPLPEPTAPPRDPSAFWPKDPDFWSAIDLSHHLDTVEAPMLFHFADSEVSSSYRLMRDLADARLPFEAFTFPNEFHFKFQPAHRLNIYNRNLDWFRFWLQDYEDPDPAKAQQYTRWRGLRRLQCRNPRALRNYCGLPGASD